MGDQTDPASVIVLGVGGVIVALVLYYFITEPDITSKGIKRKTRPRRRNRSSRYA